MKQKTSGVILFLIFFCSQKCLLAQDDKKWESDFSTELELEQRLFFNEGLYAGQEQLFTSGALIPELSVESTNGKHQFGAKLFGRLAQHDDQRSHVDIRELFYRYKGKGWSVLVGSNIVFWGVTESNHLVDIINQTDQVEGVDGEDKLGQPMIQLTKNFNFGTFELYYLPYARRRQFPGAEGRFRFPDVLERDDIPFENYAEEWSPSFAFRWSHYLGSFDVGVSNFYGIAREPQFLGFDPQTGLRLSYPVINQTGLDVQFTKDAWLLKLESIYRTSDDLDFFAFTAGFEYTFSDIKSSGIDVGIVSEYLFDERKELTFSGFDNDIFVGTRVAFNDVQSTEFITGGIFDVSRSTYLYSFEGSRRIGESWKIAIEARVFGNVSEEELLFAFREDDLFQIKISKFF
ncbi:hypothetical protein [Winogradskyella sp.]|uniref:hypothetical protein n=1 Tax=Winogradskyella sp. TaxID=1883156 RepID=UPI003BA957F0